MSAAPRGNQWHLSTEPLGTIWYQVAFWVSPGGGLAGHRAHHTLAIDSWSLTGAGTVGSRTHPPPLQHSLRLMPPTSEKAGGISPRCTVPPRLFSPLHCYSQFWGDCTPCMPRLAMEGQQAGSRAGCPHNLSLWSSAWSLGVKTAIFQSCHLHFQHCADSADWLWGQQTEELAPTSAASLGAKLAISGEAPKLIPSIPEVTAVTSSLSPQLFPGNWVGRTGAVGLWPGAQQPPVILLEGIATNVSQPCWVLLHPNSHSRAFYPSTPTLFHHPHWLTFIQFLLSRA